MCDERSGVVFRTRAEIAAELSARDRFFTARLDRHLSQEQLRDLTNVTLGTPAAILRCTRCGTLIRDTTPDEAVFRDDAYDDRVMESLHAMHARAFRAKESDYRPLLPQRARVVEVGSYVGGFLSTASEWGWQAIGTDIGRDPVRFCRARGLDARCVHFEECALDAESFHAVFIWNCFEQLARPDATLAEAHRVLLDRGLLVIRVPDADFYMRCEQRDVLAYNNLLGWPHLFGYGTRALRRLVRRHGFAFVRSLRRPAIRPLRDAMQPWAREEEARLLGDANHGWIEVSFEKH